VKTATRKQPSKQLPEKKTPNRISPLLFALSLTILLAAISALPRVRTNLRLAGSLWAASACLLILILLLRRDVARKGRTLSCKFLPLKAHYVQLGLQFCLYAYWGWYWHRVYLFVPLIVAQLVFLYALDMLVSWFRRDQWILGFGPVPIVLSTNVFLWFKDDWFFLQFLLVATGVLCKEFIKWERDGRRTHIFNPSAVALFVFSVGLILTHSTSITWGQEIATTFERPPNIYIEIFLLGIVVQALFSVTLVTLAAAAVLYVLNLGYTRVTGVYFFVDSNIPAAVFLGLHLLVTDPSTSPRKSLGKVVFGGLYGAAVFALYGGLVWMGAPGFYDKLLCIPILNLMVRRLDRWSVSLSERLPSLNWMASWSARQSNFAHMGIWITLFAVMLTTGFVGPHHPGRDSEFWHKACQQGKWGACKTWAQTLEIDCHGASAGDCLTRASEFYRLFNQAEERVDRHDPVKAIPLFQKALEFSPENVRGNTHLANALARRGRLDDAITHYRKALDANPEYLEARTNLGVALADQGKLDEAVACYERALEVEPKYIEAQADLGIALFRQGKTDEAMLNLERTLAVKPDFAQAHINLGVVLIQKGSLAEAIQQFEAALKQEPENGEAQSNLAVTLLRMGKLEEAIPHLEKALVATPDSPELHTNLGGALAQDGRLDEAIVHLQKAVELSPDSASLHANLAGVLVQRGRWKEALRQFDRALALTPDSAPLQTSFGMALLEHGQPVEAIPHFEKALALVPADPQARSYLGSALRLQGRAAEALTQWQQALEAQPDLLQALDEAAWVMATNRESSVRNGPKAVELAERAVQVSGGQQPRILATLAASYAEAGQFPKAVETAHRALDLASEQNQWALAGGLHAMIARYESGSPFRDVR
jgi:tetratricopeptide (TPR) repeat protein